MNGDGDGGGVDPSFLFSHNEILEKLSNWNGGLGHSSRHLLVASNYPWLFNSKNEVKPRDDMRPHKLLPIVSLTKMGRKSLSCYKCVVLHDKYAKLIEALSMCKVFARWTRGMCRTKPSDDYKMCLLRGKCITNKLKIMYSKHNNTTTTTMSSEFILQIYNAIYNNDEQSAERLYWEVLSRQVEVTDADIVCHLNSRNSAQYLRRVCDIVMANNKRLVTQIQGKESVTRLVVPKRVLANRAQICLAPYLHPNQIGLPAWWAKRLYLDYTKLRADNFQLQILDTHQLYDKLPEQYTYRLHGQRIISKRDPIINVMAVGEYDEVFFVNDSRAYVGSDKFIDNGGDLDGDTYTIYTSTAYGTQNEVDFNINPSHRMILHNQPRVKFLESSVLLMYKRKVDYKFPYWQLYNLMRRRCTYIWLKNIQNCAALENIARLDAGNPLPRRFSLETLYGMVEPTETILSHVLFILATIVDSETSCAFYNRILQMVMELAIKHEDALLYQSNLPCDYTLNDNLLNVALLTTSLSLAKGSVHTLQNMLEKLFELDHTTKLTAEVTPHSDLQKKIDDIKVANVYAAEKSRKVPEHGYSLSKSTIEGDVMGFGGNALNYDNQILIKNVHTIFPLTYIIKPCVLFSIIYDEIGGPFF